MSAELTGAPAKPLLRGVSHEVFFFVAVVAGAILVNAAPTSTAKLVCGIYALSLATLLGVSALYHRINWSVRARARMRRLDHSAIFVLIAGTYTPLTTTLAPGPRTTMLVLVWIGAALGVLRAIFWVDAPKWLVAVLAVALGWMCVWYGVEIHAAIGTASIVWMGVGGVLYSLGALAYALKRPNPWPTVFGYHELFHALVIAAAASHFVAIASSLPIMRG